MKDKLAQANAAMQKALEAYNEMIASKDPTSPEILEFMELVQETLDAYTTLLRAYTEANERTRRQVREMYERYHLEDWGHVYDETLSPLENLKAIMDRDFERMVRGRVWAARVKEAVLSGDEKKILEIARKAEHMPFILPERYKDLEI